MNYSVDIGMNRYDYTYPCLPFSLMKDIPNISTREILVWYKNRVVLSYEIGTLLNLINQEVDAYFTHKIRLSKLKAI
jgi:hypothetical protein